LAAQTNKEEEKRNWNISHRGENTKKKEIKMQDRPGIAMPNAL
jgi:hypothetical protein